MSTSKRAVTRALYAVVYIAGIAGLSAAHAGANGNDNVVGFAPWNSVESADNTYANYVDASTGNEDGVDGRETAPNSGVGFAPWNKAASYGSETDVPVIRSEPLSGAGGFSPWASVDSAP